MSNGGDILEIGFGMGISAAHIQNQDIKSQQTGSSPIIIGGSTSNSATSNSNLNTFSQAGAHPNKSIVTSMVSKK